MLVYHSATGYAYIQMWDSIVVLWGLVKMCNPKAMFFLQHCRLPIACQQLLNIVNMDQMRLAVGRKWYFVMGCDGLIIYITACGHMI